MRAFRHGRHVVVTWNKEGDDTVTMITRALIVMFSSSWSQAVRKTAERTSV